MSQARIARYGWLAVVALLACGPLSAQTTTGSLTGKVRTDTGGAVADAVIQARAEANGTVRTTVSDARGRYRLDLMHPGTWTVVARLTDGQVSASREVLLHLQETVQLDFEVGAGLAERVVVRPQTPLVDRKETAGKFRISSSQIDSMPLSGRQFTDLASLDSTVRPAAPGTFYGERRAVFMVNGQSGRSNSFLVDGLDNNDQVSGTNLNSSFSQLVIDEFVLLKHQFAPEFGRASGAVLNIVTKQGTNDFGWQAFAQGTNASWNSAGDFVEGLPDPPDVPDAQDSIERFQTGFSVGGPIRKDRMFYFLAYEHQEADDVRPYTGKDGSGLAGGRVVAPTGDDNFFARFDFNLDAKRDLMLRLSADDRSDRFVNVEGVLTPTSGFRIDEQDLQLAAALTSVMSPHVISETRVLASTSDFRQRANSSAPGVSRPSGVFGGNNLNSQDRDEQLFQLVQNFTVHRNSHTMKFGVDLLRSRTDVAARFNPNGNFIYNFDTPFEPGDCGNLNPFLVQQARDDGTYPIVPCPGIRGEDDDGDGVIDEPGNIESYPLVYTLIDGEPRNELEDTRVALFGQDRVEVGKRWILDYGLRYELNTYELPPSAAVPSFIPNGGARRDYDNVAPRFGFTFSPDADGKLIVRGGAGVFYDKLVLAFPAVAAITSDTAIQFAFPQSFAFEITEAFIEANGPEAAEAATIPPLELKFSTGSELETPHTTQFNLGVDRRIGRHGALRADLVRVLGFDLPLFQDLNLVTCVPDLEEPLNEPSCIGIPGHPDTSTGSIAALTTNGRSWYTGLDLNYRWQAEPGWFSAGYTLSRSEDLGPDPLKDGVYFPSHSDNIRGERSRADGDRKHRVVVSGDFAVPWMGLRASAVAQYMSGLPFNVTTGRDDNFDGILADRPEGVSRNSGDGTPLSIVNALRQEADLAPVGQLDEPRFYQVDLRVYKTFALAERRGAGEIFVQVFNVFDRENAGRVEGRATAQSFGQMINLAGPPRIVELGLKYGY